jgi:hypothetical protein
LGVFGDNVLGYGRFCIPRIIARRNAGGQAAGLQRRQEVELYAKRAVSDNPPGCLAL